MTALESKPAQTMSAFAEHPAIHAEYKLRNAAINSWPYAHTVVNDILPDWFYASMLEHFPEDEAFTPLNEYHPDRGAIFLTADREDFSNDLSSLNKPQRAFWESFVEMFGSERFRAALLGRLAGEQYVDRFIRRSHALMHLSLDRRGYQIAPHTDVASKIITALFYLPEPANDPAQSFGTSVLVEKPDHNHLPEQDWDRYDIAYTTTFSPNTMFTFVVGKHSWHAVRPVDKPIRRRSLQCFLMLDE